MSADGEDPTRRLLALLSLLQPGVALDAGELGSRLGVSARTVRRDVTRLRELGYAVTARTGPGGAYRLVRGGRMPPLLFDDDEVTALIAGLRVLEPLLADDLAAERARAKLERLLPDRLRRQASATASVVEVVADDLTPGVGAQAMRVLAAAAVADRRVAFAYRDRRGRASERRVDPDRLVLRRGRWALVGVDADRGGWRVFRPDRTATVRELSGHHPRPPLPAATVAEWYASDLDKPAIEVSVVFEAPAERVLDALGPVGNANVAVGAELTAIDPRRCRYRARVTSLDWFAATTALLGLPFAVEQPAELAGACRRLGGRLSAAG